MDTRYVYAPETSWSSYWPEIIALYAVDANLSAGEDVIVIDEESKVRIRQMFWRMQRIESYVEQIEIPQEVPEEPELPEDESASSVPEPTMSPPLYRYVLHITVSGKSVHEIASLLGFSAEQNEILNELLSESMRPSLMGLCAGISAGAISWPLPGYSNITTIFGVDDAFGNPGHKGIDIAAPEWTPIYAAHSGTVTLSAWSDSYGNQVVLDNGMGLSTRYAHMVESAVSVGDVVSAGQVIGYVGSTGWSTGNHLHFEVVADGALVDPLLLVGP